MKPEIFIVGPDVLSEYDLENVGDVDWILYWYEYERYEGKGYLIAKRGNKFSLESLGHCSCYGPCDDVAMNFTSLYNILADIRTSPDDYDHECMSALNKKIRQILVIED